jgi:hypothetical protein
MQGFSSHFAKASCCPRSRLSVARRFSGHHLYQPSLCSSKRCTTAVQISNDRFWRKAAIREYQLQLSAKGRYRFPVVIPQYRGPSYGCKAFPQW